MRHRVALVTGGSRGIGRACAIRLAEAGFDIAVTYRTRTREARTVAQRIRALGRDVVTIQADVARPEAVARLVTQVRRRWGRIDVLVNNAGIASVTPFQRIRAAEWDAMLAVNLRGAFLCCQRVAPMMTSQRCGSIILMASQAGQTGGAFVGAHYAVSKAGLICLAKYLAKELAGSGVRVNCVAPGIIDTEMARAFPRRALHALVQRVPLRRLGTSKEVAGVVAFLASEESAYLTGATIPVNGGLWMP